MKKNNYIPFGERWEKMLLRKTKAELVAMYKSECKRNDVLSVKIELDQKQFDAALGIITTHYKSTIKHYIHEINKKVLDYQMENTFMTIFDQIYEDIYEIEKILDNKGFSDGWVSIDDFLPEEGQLVWITNGEGFTTLGCWVWTDRKDGSWCWCDASNQLIYQDVDKIVADCEVDDLDVKYWYPVPEVKTDIK